MGTAEEWVGKEYEEADKQVFTRVDMESAFDAGRDESGLEITFLKVQIQELESAFKSSQVAYSTQARNALTELEEGDEQGCIDSLKALSGDI